MDAVNTFASSRDLCRYSTANNILMRLEEMFFLGPYLQNFYKLTQHAQDDGIIVFRGSSNRGGNSVRPVPAAVG